MYSKLTTSVYAIVLVLIIGGDGCSFKMLTSLLTLHSPQLAFFIVVENATFTLHRDLHVPWVNSYMKSKVNLLTTIYLLLHIVKEFILEKLNSSSVEVL